MGRTRDRTFTGCWTCRSRKVKCDESKPECRPCQRLGVLCGGYGPRLIWIGQDAQGYRSDGRRFLRCDMTWKGCEPLSDDLIDQLILQCDDGALPFGEAPLFTHSYNPFSVFQNLTPEVPRPDDDSLTVSVSRPLNAYPDMSSEEQHLFHHYINYVAVIMMPYDHPRNPWTSHYPAAALQKPSLKHMALYRAILAHSAFNLAQLRPNDDGMAFLASRHYSAAIQHLVPDMGMQEDAIITVASIMTLLMAEVYTGQSANWRAHLRGASMILQQNGDLEPWTSSDFACSSIQSLRIIDIIGKTSARSSGYERLCETRRLDNAFSMITSTPGFGFTIGATQTILECISEITHLKWDMDQDIADMGFDDRFEQILSRLNAYRAEEALRASSDLSTPDTDIENLDSPTTESPEAINQINAFIYATYIYLYRSLLNVPPQNLTRYVSQVFTYTMGFLAESKGNFSIWPAFIAAVESYTPQHIEAAKAWLSQTCGFGMGNRIVINRTVKAVWQRREEESERTGTNIGLISVDWRQIMAELGYDVLIV